MGGEIRVLRFFLTALVRAFISKQNNLVVVVVLPVLSIP